ncbi:MAG: hypothetical protein AB7S26_20715 [Sandaracinaceae bacterium]
MNRDEARDRGTNDLEARLERMERNAASAAWWRRATLALLMLIAMAPFAAGALGPVPHTFTNGAVISASEMNANFTYLQNAITNVEGAVPSGAIMYFNASTCPAGWTEVTAARGRTIVGLAGSAGTVGGTVGVALTDRENRGHTHTTSLSTVTTASAGGHVHQWMQNGNATYDMSGVTLALMSVNVSAGAAAILTRLPLDPASDFYTSSSGSHTHGFSGVAPTSSSVTTSQVIPYVQYLVCQRM